MAIRIEIILTVVRKDVEEPFDVVVRDMIKLTAARTA